MYATGSNIEAARMMGVKTDKTFCLAHMISGFMTGVSGIILASRIGSVSPLAGDGQEMYAIAACVVGGVHLSGGRGKISNVFIGAAIIGLLTNIFNMQRLLSTFWESVITGSLVLIVVLVQSSITMREERKRELFLTYNGFFDMRRFCHEFNETVTKEFEGKTYTLSPTSHLLVYPFPVKAMQNSNLKQNSK